MKKVIINALILISFLTPSYASHTLDVYGLDDKRAAEIIKKYGTTILTMEKQLLQQVVDGKENDKLTDELVEKRFNLMQKIKRDNHFLFVDFQTTSYSDRNLNCTTIEIIDKNQAQRLAFVDQLKSPNKPVKKNDVIEKMEEYNEKSMMLFMRNQLKPPKKNFCPSYHCTFGFDHPQLKAYYPLFKQATVKQRSLILNTLNHDPNPSRRGAAAFLVGHFSNPHEIIKLLMPHIMDKDSGVRNNVIRVIGSVMHTAHIQDIDVKPFVKLLDSPYGADRNKSLNVLQEVAQSRQGKNYLLHYAKTQLVALLQLKQPNNHNMAYQILKTISAKQYADTDIAAWKKWQKTVS